MITKLRKKFIAVTQGNSTFYVMNIEAGHLVNFSYASVRGVDEEEGAVQRVLNQRRILGIKEFLLDGGEFPNSIILNWANSSSISVVGDTIEFNTEPRSAQLIDGQHRVAGLREAIDQDDKFLEYEIPVAIYIGLTSKKCAEIFLSINTEQKAVNKSLVFDLFQLAEDSILVDVAATRAREIADMLNEVGAPYEKMIKYPGEKPRKGGVALSTVVSAIKPLVEQNGSLDQVGVSEFESQSAVLRNFFETLVDRYGADWSDRSNAFIYASGFSGAIDFFAKRLVPFCVTESSFKRETMYNALKLPDDSLLQQADVSKMSGTEARRHVYLWLDGYFNTGKKGNQYEI